MDEHARLLAAAGHQVTVISKHGQRPSPDVAWEGLAEHGPVELLGRLRGLLATESVVIIHNVLTMPFEPLWTQALWALAEELPATRFIGWIHDLAAVNPDYTGQMDPLLRKAHPRVTYVAVSELRRQQFAELTGTDCQVIPNGIAPARILGLSEPVARLADEHRLLSGRRLVLFHPARLVARKNVELSLGIVAALRDQGRDCCLLVTSPPDPHNPGSAQYAQRLLRLRSELALDAHALFLNDLFEVHPTDMPGLYCLADGLLLPSRQEGFGLPLLEAGLHGIPLFCSDIEPLRSLVEGSHRFMPDSLPSEIALLIGQSLDHNPHIQTRKSILRRYAWTEIWENSLAPLLKFHPSNRP